VVVVVVRDENMEWDDGCIMSAEVAAADDDADAAWTIIPLLPLCC